MEKLYPLLSVLFLIYWGCIPPTVKLDSQTFIYHSLLSPSDYEYKYIGERVEFVKTYQNILTYYKTNEPWWNSNGRSMSYNDLVGKQGVLNWIKIEPDKYGGESFYRWYNITLDDGRELFCKKYSSEVSINLTKNVFIPKVYVLSEYEDLKSKYLNKSIWLNNPRIFTNIYPNPVFLPPPTSQEPFKQFEEVIVKEVIPFKGGFPPFYYFRLESLNGEKTCYIQVPIPSNKSNIFFDEPMDEKTYLCTKITREVDKFDDKISFSSPGLTTINYSKYLDGYDERIYLRISVNGSTLNHGCRGVTLLLKSGERITWSDESIETGYDEFDHNWTYTSFTLLNKEIIEKLKDDPITDVKLYIYTSSIDYPEIYSTFLNCILDMN